MNKNVEILDCTIRDGGYITEWNFDKHMVQDVYEASSKAGVDIFEIGYIGNENDDVGTWKKCLPKDVAEVVNGSDGAKIAAMVDFKRIDELEIPSSDETDVDLIRLALHKNQVEESIKYLEKIKELGYELSVQAMGITGYSEQEIIQMLEMLGKNKNVDYLYIADSYGSITPQELTDLIKIFKSRADCKIGFHPHNNLQLGLANTLTAIEEGIDIVDGTLYGMGRGAGNLPIESLIAYLSKTIKDKYNPLPLLEVIDRYFVQLKEEYSWGYNLPYLLSGIYECHPYYTKNLVEYREFTIEDILKAVRKINNINPIGFNEELLNKFINDGFIQQKEDGFSTENLKLDKNLKSKDDELVKYKNRHKGKDFLVLANGPNLKKYKDKIDKFIEKYDPVILGANFLDDLIIPDYHAFNNKRRFNKYIDTVNEKSNLLIGNSIAQELINQKINKNYELMQYIDSSTNDFNILNGIITTNCRTISILLIGIAVVMGADRIFVAGMDGYLNYDSSYHFYKEDEAKDNEIIKNKHEASYNYLKQINNYLKENDNSGFHIITPTDYEKFYKGIENYL